MSKKERRERVGKGERTREREERGGRVRDGRVLRRKTENERATERSGAVLSWLYRRERLLRRLPRRKRRRSGWRRGGGERERREGDKRGGN